MGLRHFLVHGLTSLQYLPTAMVLWACDSEVRAAASVQLARKGSRPAVLLTLKILHDLCIQYCHNTQSMRYLGSCRISSIHRRVGR